MKKVKNITCVLIIGLILMVQLFSSSTVHADGETTTPPTEPAATNPPPTEPPVTNPPPPPTGAAGVTPQPPPTEPPADTSTPVPTETAAESTETAVAPTNTAAEPSETSVSTETLVVTETPLIGPVVTETSTVEPVATGPTEEETPEPTAAPTQEPISTETTETATEAPTTTSEPTEVPAAEEPTINEVLQTIPAETSVVVLDENGQPISLVTADAAKVVSEGDPIWCPEGVLIPTPGENGCTTTSTTFGGPDGLLSKIVDKTQAGVIWIAYDYNHANAIDNSQITIDGADLGTTANFALTIQGGWHPGGIIIDNSTVHNIQLLNWNNTITIKNLNVTGSFLATTTDKVNMNDGTNNLSKAWGVVISNIKFNGKPAGSMVATDNSPVTVTFDYQVWNPTYPGCAGCITQIVPGISDTPAGYCSYDGIPDSWNNGTPQTIGTDSHTYSGLEVGKEYYLNVTHGWMYNCTDALGLYKGKKPTTPKVLVPILAPLGSAEFDLKCIGGQDGFAIALPNGDLVNIICPITGKGYISRLDNTTLPASLPDGYTYASAFRLDITQNGQKIPVTTEGGFINASFIAQPLQAGGTYTILYWDAENNNWIPLKEYLEDANGRTQSFKLFAASSDLRSIISGAKTVKKGQVNRIDISANFPGVFVLAQK